MLLYIDLVEREEDLLKVRVHEELKNSYIRSDLCLSLGTQRATSGLIQEVRIKLKKKKKKKCSNWTLKVKSGQIKNITTTLLVKE